MKTSIDAKRGTMFLVEPENLFVATDPEHPLYDPRANKPISAEMVASILAKNVIEPIIVRKNGKTLEVVDGRQRTKNAVEANKRLRAEGAPTLCVPVIVRKEDDVEAYETSVSLNEIREDDDVITKAEKAAKLTKMGRTEAEVARAFGVTLITIRTWSRIFDLAPQVRTAIKNGDVGASEAVKELAELTREEQVTKLDKMRESSPAARKSERRAANGKANGKSEGKKSSPISRLRRLYRDEEAMGHLSPREKVLIAWLFAEATAGDLVEAMPRLSGFVSRRK